MMDNFFKELNNLGLSIHALRGDLVLKGKRDKLSSSEIDKIRQNTSLTSFIRSNKDKLIEVLETEDQFNEDRKISLANIDAIYGLSPMQEGMLFHYRYDKSTLSYVEQTKLDFEQGVNIDALQKSFEYILKKHTILRTSFISDKVKTPIQCVNKVLKLPICLVDFSMMEPGKQETEFQELLNIDLTKGFDLAKPPLMRVTLVNMGSDHYKMIWTFHHIILDGWSVAQLVSQIMEVYEKYKQGNDPVTPDEDKFEDYIKYINARNRFEEERFWKSYLEGIKNPSLLPFVSKSIKRNIGQGRMRRINLDFSEEFSSKISAYCKQQQLTTNSLLQGVWAFLLSKYTGQKKVVFGVTVSGRPSDLLGAENKVGLYINTIPYCAKYEDRLSFEDWLRELQSNHSAAREFQYSSLSTIQKWSDVKGTFFDSILVFENYPASKAFSKEGNQLKISNVETVEQSNYLLTLIAGMREKLELSFSFNNALLNVEFVELIKKQFESLLNIVIAQPKQSLSEVAKLLSQADVEAVYKFNDTEAVYPENETLNSLFERQALKAPDRIALSFEKETMTYWELDKRSNEIAQLLISKEIAKGEMVGVFLNRSFDMIASILGIIKAGATYVPIDTNYPLNRIKYMIQNAGVKHIITTDVLTKKSRIEDIIPVLLDTLEQSDFLNDKLELRNDSGCPAYMMYTSGSTGSPKGVVVNHQAIIRLIFNPSFEFLNNESVLYQFAPTTFDASTFEIWGALLKGGQLVIASPGNKSLEEIGVELQMNKVNTLWLTAALFHTCVDSNIEIFSSIQYLLSGGESINVESIKKVKSRYKELVFINGYGPTESTTFAISNMILAESDIVTGMDVIGRPIGNTKAYVLEWETDNMVPLGCPGELCLAGPGLAKGYHQDPKLTREKFTQNPFNKSSKYNRIYRTGDMVRWMPNGTIEFIGRKDEQVKIRGFRIELGEVIQTLNDCRLVKQSTVVVHESESNNNILIAYVIPEDKFDSKAIQTFLESKLPSFMCPSIIIPMDVFPMNANGKLARNKLPKPETLRLVNDHYEAPRNELEHQLVEIWSNLLHIEKIGVNDNFFDLGGHSLLASRLATALKSRFKINIPLKVLFSYATIHSLAKYIKIVKRGSKPAQRTDAKVIEV